MRKPSVKGDPLAGKRIKALRILHNLKQKDFAQIGINENTLSTWEQGKSILTEKGARLLEEKFKQKGIICSAEWLLYGIGNNPDFFSYSDPSLPKNIPDSDFAILMEINTFKQYNSNGTVVMVQDDAMLPLYSPGDYVGGIMKKNGHLKNILGKICIIEPNDGNVVVRYLHPGSTDESFTITGMNHQSRCPSYTLKDIKVNWAAPVIWYRKTKE